MSTLSKVSNLPAFYINCLASLKRTVNLSNKLFDHQQLAKYFKQHSIMVKHRDDGTLKFKYSAMCRFNEDFTYACRGTTLTPSGEFIPAFNKFFNEHEFERVYGFKCDQLWKEYATKNCNFRVKAFSKVDGTNIQASYLPTEDRFEITTLGSLNACIMQGNVPGSPTFEDKFKELAGSNTLAVIKSHPELSFIFEMCSRYNNIVTQYSKEFVQLLGVIDRKSGLPINHPDAIAEITATGVSMPISWDVDSTKGRFQLDDIMQDIANDPVKFGQNPEGLVLTLFFKNKFGKHDLMIPFVKIKRKEYLVEHGTVVLNPGNFRDKCNIEELVLKGEDDDLPEEVQREHAQVFRRFLEQQCQEFEELISDLKHSDDAKQYAMKVVELTKQRKQKWLKSFLFDIKNMVLNNEDSDSWELFTAWLLTNSKGNSENKLRVLQKDGSMDHPWFALNPDQKKTVVPKAKIVESSESQSKVFVCDLDNSLWDNLEKPVGYHGDWWADPKSLEQLKPRTRIVNMTNGYFDAGFKVVFLTGRKTSLYKILLTELRNIFPFQPLTLVCTPEKQSTAEYKSHVINMLSQVYERVVYLDDDLNNHASLQPSTARITQLVIDGDNIQEYNSKMGGVFVLFVQPPGTGKTTMFKKFEHHVSMQLDSQISDTKIYRLSYDVMRREYKQNLIDMGKTEEEVKDIMSSRSTSEEIHSNFMKLAKFYYRKGYVILVDACNDRWDNIKSLKKIGRVKSFSMVPLTKDSKGKDVISPGYLSWALKNILARKECDTESTLITDDHKYAIKALFYKAGGCGMQLTNADRGIEMIVDWWVPDADKSYEGRLLANKINKLMMDAKNNKLDDVSDDVWDCMRVLADQVQVPDEDEMFQMFYERLLPVIQESPDDTAEASFYMAAPVKSELLPMAKHSPIKIPHVTVARPGLTSDQMQSLMHLLGQEVQITTIHHYYDSKIEFLTATVEEIDVEHAHITLSTSKGTTPVTSFNKLKEGVDLEHVHSVSVKSVILAL